MTNVRSSRKAGLTGLSLGISLSLASAPAAVAAPNSTVKATVAAQETKDAPKEAATLPGGAQALNETFEDWQVACGSSDGTKRCVVNQTQTDTKTKQRVLALELQPHNKDAVGALVLPFGLDLDKGIVLKADDAQIGPSLRFKTCLPQGCVVALNFDQKTLETLRKAAAISVIATADPGQTLSFKVSLKGFAPALSRAASLTE
jgi:invasion protein IalB